MEFNDDLKEHLEKVVYQGLGHPQGHHPDDLPIGHFEPIWSEEATEIVMKNHVGKIDLELWRTTGDPLKQGSLLRHRGVTFAEYRQIFGGLFGQDDYRTRPFLRALFLTDEASRRSFTLKNTDDFAGYTQALEAYKLPILDFFFRRRLKFFLPVKSLTTHAYAVAMSGAGKSELLKLMFYSLQEQSHDRHKYSLVMIEPHGQLVSDLFAFRFNAEQRQRLIYLNPYIHKEMGIEDIYTPVINPFELEDKSEENIRLMTNQLTTAFLATMKANAELTPTMTSLVRPCIEVVLRIGGDMQDVLTFMNDGIDKENRPNKRLYEAGLKFPHLKEFFESRFYSSGFSLTKNSLYNKLSSILGEPTFRNFICGKTTVNLENAINTGKILLFKLDKGGINADVSEAIGKFVIALLYGYAMKRDPNSPHNKQVFCFVDECQNFLSPTIGEALAEVRKYKMSLILCQQFVGQKMENELEESVLENTSIKIIGRSGKNPTKMARETGISGETLKGIKKFQFLIQNKQRDGEGENLIFETPNFLCDRGGAFYMTEGERKQLLEYFAHDSGYYTKVQKPNSQRRDKGDFADDGRREESQRDPNAGQQREAPKPKFDDF